MSGDAKLRELRAWIRSHVSYPLPDSPAGQLSIESVLLKIQRLLAELGEHHYVVAKAYGERFMRCDRCGRYASAEPPRESLAEEVARLHGFVGPDGRGRP